MWRPANPRGYKPLLLLGCIVGLQEEKQTFIRSRAEYWSLFPNENTPPCSHSIKVCGAGVWQIAPPLCSKIKGFIEKQL